MRYAIRTSKKRSPPNDSIYTSDGEKGEKRGEPLGSAVFACVRVCVVAITSAAKAVWFAEKKKIEVYTSSYRSCMFVWRRYKLSDLTSLASQLSGRQMNKRT